ncbi:hypothetical protein BCR41DRAFT_390828 [Lobosporangium transversale]|uniref:Monopolin complex subunit Csm1/Pcs1 C-terminal domain-containing protein n=1 Tax=Lobosporangium transversale TaxID=64571 RepID=A0A1Y2G5K2_9FUNG|nr:hypothetical protein BCR41DRAFT_390828 [Lobosporangium transversale]ORY95165.1 hypothetical protein BCR41DRAFT_390828 [Lobosporangium transversale]|eukprot:XP_021875372.1 hypothetical protein BCR41DRAFT_390828 [Lobosporangium transversale]
MPPKRAKTVNGAVTTTKRIKGNPSSPSDSDSEVATKEQKKTTDLWTLPKQNGLDQEDELVIPKRYRTQKQQPMPKKKASALSSTTKATSITTTTAAATPKFQDSYTKPQQQPQATSVLRNAKSISSLENQENQILTTNSAEKTIAKPKDNGVGKIPIKTGLSMSYEQLEAAYHELNTKYKRLKQLKETDAEKNLEDYRAKLEEANCSAENYRTRIEPQLESALRTQEKLRDNNEVLNAKVRTLQRQLREYEEKIRQRELEDKAKAKTASLESILASPEVTPTSTGVMSTIKMYENLSGLKVIPQDIYPLSSSRNTLPKVWDCEHSGPHGTLCFTLTYDYEKKCVSYEPHLDATRDEKLMQVLPEYLTTDIEFDQEFESKFFWRILNFNHEDSKV